MIDRTLALGASAVLAHTLGYWLFIGETRHKDTTPNLATWAVWCALVTLSAFVYKDVTGSYTRSAQYFVGIIGSSIVCVYALHGSKRDPLTRIEKLVMYACLAALATWFITRSVAITGWITAAAIAISSIPTIRRTAKSPGNASMAPWLCWSVGFVSTIMNGYLAPQSDPLKIMIPLTALSVDMIVVVLLLIARSRRPAPTTQTVASS